MNFFYKETVLTCFKTQCEMYWLLIVKGMYSSLIGMDCICTYILFKEIMSISLKDNDILLTDEISPISYQWEACFRTLRNIT